MPIDKAPVYIPFICKQFYSSVKAKEVELGLNNN